MENQECDNLNLHAMVPESQPSYEEEQEDLEWGEWEAHKDSYSDPDEDLEKENWSMISAEKEFQKLRQKLHLEPPDAANNSKQNAQASTLKQHNKILQEQWEQKIFLSPQEELQQREIFRSIQEEEEQRKKEKARSLESPQKQQEMIQKKQEEFQQDQLKRHAFFKNMATGKLKEASKGFGKFNRKMEYAKFKEILDIYLNGGCLTSDNSFVTKLDFDAGKKTADSALFYVNDFLLPSYMLEGPQSHKFQNNFVLCCGMNKTLNPTGDYKIAKKPVMAWKDCKTNLLNAFRAFFDLGLWVALAVPEGFIVLDIDSQEDVPKIQQHVLGEHNKAIKTDILQTNNGFHLWFQDNTGPQIKNTHHILKNGMKATIRKHGSYVIFLSHWKNQEFSPGFPKEYKPKLFLDNSEFMAFFSSRFWVSFSDKECPFLLPDFEPQCVDHKEKEYPTTQSEQFWDFQQDANLPMGSLVQETQNKPQTKEKYLTIHNPWNAFLFNCKTKNPPKEKFALRDFVIQNCTGILFNLLPNDTHKLIQESQPAKGRFDKPTHAIVSQVRKFCKTKGKRHLTFLSCGVHAGQAKLSLPEIIYILQNIYHFTDNFPQSSVTFAKGYLFGATQRPSSHAQKIQSRPKGLSKQEGEEIFIRDQIIKTARYLKNLKKIPKYITSEELEAIGIHGNCKGLGVTKRIRINGKQTRVREVNPYGVRKLKLNAVNFEREDHQKKFLSLYLLFKGNPKPTKPKKEKKFETEEQKKKRRKYFAQKYYASLTAAQREERKKKRLIKQAQKFLSEKQLI
ncbi:MAG: bifunctional DNA primase/polymerase [Patescibacteria group bacterium]|nr:bifunctional DNA primase/polymerase [Patescibacteria group bacterium]